MYGCKYIGYTEDYCDLDKSYGWGWVACAYFIVFVIVGVMVLIALFIGVIVTSMDLLQLSINEEDKMLKKVAKKQAEFQFSDTVTAILLEVFEMIDIASNGILSVCRVIY